MKKILFLLFLTIPFVAFSQSDLNLGDYVKLTKNNIEFKFKKPLYPFVQSNESFSLGGNDNLVVSFMNDNPVVLQIYSTPIPLEFQKNADAFFSSKQGIASFINQLFPPPVNELLEYKVVVVNGKKFVELKLIAANVQKHINWITFYKNNMINISCGTLIKDFDNILPFIIDFSNSIIIK